MRKVITAVMMVALVCGLAANSYSQEIGFKGIGGRLGLVLPEDPVDNTIGFGAHANLGEVFLENLFLYPSVDYWTKSVSSVDFSQLGINADARYYFPSGGNISFFGGGGLALIFSTSGVDIAGYSNSDTNTDIGLDLFGGLDLPIGEKLLFTAEARLVLSDLQSFRIYGGITYPLGQ